MVVGSTGGIPMAHKYLVDLTEEEQGYLLDVIHKGKTAVRRVARAHVLLRAAEGATDEDIAQTLHLGIASVHRIRQRFVDEGLTAALSERPRSGSPSALSGKQAAFLVALVCTIPPVGHRRWALRLLADRFIELRQIDTISAETVRRVLKKTISNPGNVRNGVFPVSVLTMSGIGKMCWTYRPNPRICSILKCVLTKAPCS
jgi:transposase